MTKLCINGRAGEDRDEWKEEARTYCEKCFDDKIETSKAQAERVVIKDAERQCGRSPWQTNTDQSRQGLACTREKDEEQG